MKMVAAIIRPIKLDDVLDALQAIGADKLTVTEVRGISCSGGDDEIPPLEEDMTGSAPEIKIEVAVKDELLPLTLGTLRAAALTGRAGDGKIFVIDVQRVIRIRNGRMGSQVL